MISSKTAQAQPQWCINREARCRWCMLTTNFSNGYGSLETAPNVTYSCRLLYSVQSGSSLCGILSCQSNQHFSNTSLGNCHCMFHSKKEKKHTYGLVPAATLGHKSAIHIFWDYKLTTKLEKSQHYWYLKCINWWEVRIETNTFDIFDKCTI